MFTLFYSLYALVHGFTNALLYGRRGADSFAWNEHVALTVERVAVAGVALGAVLDTLVCAASWQYTLAWLAWQCVATGLIFSLPHNEAYYFGRTWMDTNGSFSTAWKAYRFGYQSPTSTAKLEFGGKLRLWLAVIGAFWFAGGVLLFTKII